MFPNVWGRKKVDFSFISKETSIIPMKCIFLHILIIVGLQPQVFMRRELLRFVNSFAVNAGTLI